jgi:hypothetical protein
MRKHDLEKAFVAIVGACCAGLFGIWTLVVLRGSETPLTGGFGDAFAPFASLAAAIASVLALWSIMHQQIELAQSREEVSNHKEEMNREKSMMEVEINIKAVEMRLVDSAHIIDIVLGKKSAGNSPEDKKLNATNFAKTIIDRMIEWTSLLDAMHNRIIALTTDEKGKVQYSILPSEIGCRVNGKVVAVYAFISISIVCGWGWMVSKYGADSSDLGTGLYGDSFGPLVGLFTTTTLLLSLGAIFTQQRELRLTRNEMKQQTQAMSSQNRLRVMSSRIAIQKIGRELVSFLMDLSIHNRPVFTDSVVKEKWAKANDVVDELLKENGSMLKLLATASETTA